VREAAGVGGLSTIIKAVLLWIVIITIFSLALSQNPGDFEIFFFTYGIIGSVVAIPVLAALISFISKD
jgi:hypothetical protein